jgi:RND superfamily putative drug exporter
VTFRSIVVPVVAIALNLLSVGARAVLLPAVMKLLGDANWYLPKSLSWLPQVEHERPLPPVAVPA